jgi:Cu+-exporting ATPase
MGLLIKGGEILQRAGDIDTVVFDKTGTITEGKPAVTRVDPESGWNADQLLAMAASVEHRSEHPLATAVVAAAGARDIPLKPVTEFRSHTGAGVSAIVERSKVVVGNAKLMRSVADVEITTHVAPEDERAETRIYVAVDGRMAGVIAVSDPIRAAAAATVSSLRRQGIEVVLLTGDMQSTAQAVAAQAGIEKVVAEVLPEGKVAEIRRLQEEGRVVAMVGDGINDAPALAQSDVGIAMASGTDIALEASDVALMRPDLTAVSSAIALSRRAMATMKQNLFWAFVYNVVGIPIAAGVLYPLTGVMLSPILASAAMALSSVSVVTNSLRLRGAALR